MSTENVPVVGSSVAITFSPETFSRIAADAQRYGLSPQSYLIALSSFQNERISAETLRAIGDLYRHDRDTLNELAR